QADLVVGPEGELPRDDESVDCVLSSQVLEHTKDPQAYLAEARRVLKRDAFLVLSAPGIWIYHPHPFDHWRWTIDGLLCELRQAGFTPVMVEGVFGPESSALQLWQDATFERLPRRLQPIYISVIQFLIGRIERRRPQKASPDGASTYVILAR